LQGNLNLGSTTVTSTTILVPKISSINYSGSTTAANPAGGETITVNGSGFANGINVYINNIIVSVTNFISSTQLTFTSPAQTAGSYSLTVMNTDGGNAGYVPGITYSALPVWSTSAGSLGSSLRNNAISTITLSASENAQTITYAVTSGSLPPGLSLASNGDITGTPTGSSSTYNFTVTATDPQNQTSSRNFSYTVTIPPTAIFTISPAVSGKTTWNLGTDGSLSIGSAGIYTITPTQTGTVLIKMWGAAGGAGGSSPGGPGGYTTGRYNFSNTSQSFSIVVGGGGTASLSAPKGAGGGGGYSGLFLGTGTGNITRAGALLVAGGGGGGVLDNANGYGGAGGGSSGTAGVGGANGSGGPGTQSAGGAAGAGRASGEVGGPLEGLNIGQNSPPERPSGGKGGSNSAYSPYLGGGVAGGTPGGGGESGTRGGDYGGPGGGGGYYGGGGGGSGGSGDGSAAGGGSGYIGGTGITNATTTAGSGLTPGNSSDSVRGSAGSPVTSSNGNPGLVYLEAL
jgi:Putative Ig domain/IPT/TIG domain